jgi:hypothetical protein
MTEKIATFENENLQELEVIYNDFVKKVDPENIVDRSFGSYKVGNQIYFYIILFYNL